MSLRKRISGFFILLFLLTAPLCSQAQIYRFAIIGDFGYASESELEVSRLVKSWKPDFIISVGDNNYEVGDFATIDDNIGQYYNEFIHPYKGKYSKHLSADKQSDSNRFFPSLGNHDWYTDDAKPYFDYFVLPGNERYYGFVKPPVHFFVIDSDINEPDGLSSNSKQARWLKSSLRASRQPFKVVYFHEPPYSSGLNGSSEVMRWPFKQWGASIVISGHDHDYERLSVDKFTYIINGLGGRSIYPFDYPVEGSRKRYNGNYGAQLASVYRDSLNFSFININGITIDSYTLKLIPAKLKNEGGSPDDFRLYQNDPNPVKKKSKIKFQISKLSRVNLVLTDTLGNEIGGLVDKQLSPATYAIEIDASNLSSGIYMYRIKAEISGTEETFNDAKRIAVTK